MYFFGESEHGIENYFLAVVENAFAAEFAEYLVRYHTEKFEVEGLVAVYYGQEIELQSAVGRREAPRRGVIGSGGVPSPGMRNVTSSSLCAFPS